jgi:hypothetical protein
LALLALTNSAVFGSLVGLQLAAADAAARSYELTVRLFFLEFCEFIIYCIFLC